MVRKANLRLVAMLVLGLLALSGPARALEIGEPVSHWKFDEGSGTIAYDSAGENHGTVYGAVWTTGQIDGALSFDGVNDYVQIADHNSLDFAEGADFSIALWFRLNRISGTRPQDLINKRHDKGYKFYYQDVLGNPAYKKIVFLIDLGPSVLAVVSTTDVDDGLWHHVIGLRAGDTLKLYLDGAREATLVGSGCYGDLSNPSGLEISPAARPFDGKIDDVRIYHRALSADQVLQLYWDGLNLHGSERAIIHLENAIAEKQEALQRIQAALQRESGAYGVLEQLLESADYADLNKRDIIAAKQNIHWALQHQQQSRRSVEESIEKLTDVLMALGWEPEPEPDPNLVAYWKFDEGSGDVAYDSAGDNHGTVHGAQWTTGQIDGALSFDGDGDYVGLDFHVSSIEGYNQGTIAGWFNSSENATQFIFSITESSTAANVLQVILGPITGTYDDEGFGFVIKRGGSFRLNMYVRNGEYAYTDGAWHHFAVSTGGGDNRIYIDGVNQPVAFAVGSGSTNEFSNINSPDSMKIGVRRINNTFSGYFAGAIDDVRIYKRALSAEEIQQLY